MRPGMKIEGNFRLETSLKLGKKWAKCPSEFFEVQPRTQALIHFLARRRCVGWEDVDLMVKRGQR